MFVTGRVVIVAKFVIGSVVVVVVIIVLVNEWSYRVNEGGSGGGSGGDGKEKGR